MNFKLISSTFGARVYVWGACAFENHDGKTIKDFIPVKRLREFAHISRRLQIVGQSYNDANDIYVDWFNTADLFTKTEDAGTHPVN